MIAEEVKPDVINLEPLAINSEPEEQLKPGYWNETVHESIFYNNRKGKVMMWSMFIGIPTIVVGGVGYGIYRLVKS